MLHWVMSGDWWRLEETLMDWRVIIEPCTGGQEWLAVIDIPGFDYIYIEFKSLEQAKIELMKVFEEMRP